VKLVRVDELLDIEAQSFCVSYINPEHVAAVGDATAPGYSYCNLACGRLVVVKLPKAQLVQLLMGLE
jgi:hypothetical protein